MKTPELNRNKTLRKMKSEMHEKAPSKKEQILEAYHQGQKDLWKIAEAFETQPSYVASVLQSAGLINGYYDLYTTPSNPLNVYSEEFRGKLGFKDLATAQKSVELLESAYQRLSEVRDRAGQHHCLVTALTMLNRARFIGKTREAEVFRHWLVEHLQESSPAHRGEGLH